MSEKITVSFEIDKSELSDFTEAVRQKFESVANQGKIYTSKNSDPNAYSLSPHKAKISGFSQLYVACIRGLLEVGKKNV